MKSTQEKILKTLLAHPESSIKELAKAVGLNNISIRHHLSTLEAEDLIVSSEERHGVGRPRLIYSLTDKGAEQFPTSYLKLTRRLLCALEEVLSQKELNKLFQDIGKEIASKANINRQDQKIESRLDSLQKILTQEGFITHWEIRDSGVYHLISISCPYHQIGLDHPEVCHLDLALVSSFFPGAVEITSCIFQGDEQCIYEIHPDLIKEESYE